MSFSGDIRELEAITGRIEREELDLEEAMALYEKGMELSDRCSTYLRETQGRIETLSATSPEEVTE